MGVFVLIGPITANIIDDISHDIGVSPTFCYIIIAILGLTIIFAVIGWIIGGKRRKKERYDTKKKICPACGGENKPDALLCRFCDEML
jgi:ribosomal protein L40E